MNRRPPPPFLHARLIEREWLTPRLVRVSLEGRDLRGLEIGQAASSVRVLLPAADRPDRLEVPHWDGNQFLLADGSRPQLRTLTPGRERLGDGLLDVWVVVHGEGVAARWGASAPLGTPAAVSGPARGYVFDGDATELIIGGDETAFSAVTQILEGVPETVAVSVFMETPGEDSRPFVPARSGCVVRWVDADVSKPCIALVEAMTRSGTRTGGGSSGWSDRSRWWAAGEAAAMQQLRKRLLSELGVPRTQATIRGYWKHGRNASEQVDDG